MSDSTVNGSGKNCSRWGRLVVLAGPSAVGKSTVVHRLREEIPDLFFSVSMTTRAPRPGEVEGVDYVFVSPSHFQECIDKGEFLEWADIHGGLQRSGTPKTPVEQALKEGRPVLIEVDLDGVRQIQKVAEYATFVFLAPPSWDELVARLIGRGTESQEVINRRMETARREMDARDEFDCVIVNDDLEQAVDQMVSLLVGSDAHVKRAKFRGLEETSMSQSTVKSCQECE